MGQQRSNNLVNYSVAGRGQMDFNISTLLKKRAELHPDKPALIFERRTLTFGGLNDWANRWSHTLAELGVTKGDRIGVLLGNCNEILEVYYGATKLGAVVVPINWRLSTAELEYICNNSGLKILVFGADQTRKVEEFRPRLAVNQYICVGPGGPGWAKDYGSLVGKFPTNEPDFPQSGGDDPAAIIYTSGTTGRPKGAVVTHANILWWCASILTTIDLRRDDRVLMVIPLIHAYAFTFGMLCIQKGCSIVLLRDFEPQKFLETIRDEKVDVFLGVPTILQRLTETPGFKEHLTGARALLSASGPLAPSLVETYTRLGIKVQNMYGITEIGAVTVNENPKKPNSVGFPVFYLQLRVIDENGSDVPTGEVGEILVKGPAVIKEYWNDPDATKQATRDGCFCTGDMARLDDEGYIYLVDRKKDVIISGGEKIYPTEVEDVLYSYPKIAEVAVIGQPDQDWGEMLCAVVRAKDGQQLNNQELIEFCKGKLASIKVPRKFITTDRHLPRNSAGKILRRLVRQQINPPEITR